MRRPPVPWRGGENDMSSLRGRRSFGNYWPRRTAGGGPSGQSVGPPRRWGFAMWACIPQVSLARARVQTMEARRILLGKVVYRVAPPSPQFSDEKSDALPVRPRGLMSNVTRRTSTVCELEDTRATCLGDHRRREGHMTTMVARMMIIASMATVAIVAPSRFAANGQGAGEDGLGPRTAPRPRILGPPPSEPGSSPGGEHNRPTHPPARRRFGPMTGRGGRKG